MPDLTGTVWVVSTIWEIDNVTTLVVNGVFSSEAQAELWVSQQNPKPNRKRAGYDIEDYKMDELLNGLQSLKPEQSETPEAS